MTMTLTLTMKTAFFFSDDVKPWWMWGYWISPMMYGQNAIVVNEFLGKGWKHVGINFMRENRQ